MSKTEMLAEAAKIQKQLESGKLKGKAIQKAKYRMYNLRYRAGQKAKKANAASEPKGKITKAEIKKIGKTVGPTLAAASKKAMAKFNKDQGFLPGFLQQMNMVRIEELIADKIFNAIKTGEMSLKPSDIKSMTAEAIESVPVFTTKKKKAG
ncbi:hypothetical protein UFOVP558_58 [uncultured Caudovirales phage]|uniref:Uncharacterized protein n=1 Tax=uncultured Caudovirales phage TaxID=2100421 RepID=A0A6J5MT12_9CAUD|nr:hypothetical protein UFOVP558_58 [uncultured Caudovirales phage]